MSTMEQNKIGLNCVEIAGESLLELLAGASTHADNRKIAIPALSTVQLRGEGGLITATATDRYRLIQGTIAGEGELSVSLISLDDIKRILALLKGEGARVNSLPVTLTRLGDVLTVSVRGNSISATLCDGQFPMDSQLENIFNPILQANDDKNMDKISFNPALFADYAKIAGKGEPVTVTFTAKNKPMLIGLGGDKVKWRGALMPMRVI